MVKAVLFDLWGTLFYHEGKINIVRQFFNKINPELGWYEFIKVFENYFMMHKITDPEAEVRKFLNNLKVDDTDSLVSELVWILNDANKGIIPYPEVLEVLNKLKEDFKLGLITNTYHPSYEALERDYNIGQYFNITLKSSEIGIIKPDKRIFEMALNKLGVRKEEAVMVGDTLEDDVKAAENNGIKGVLIDRKNKHPDYENRIISLKELKEML